jgi:uncharacterized membrane protein (UPF0127 family)
MFNVNELDIPIVECRGFYQRTKGLMFKKEKIDYGLLFKNCNSIHTFFMYQPIDVIMTDKEDKIICWYKHLLPNNIIFPKRKVYNTYELPVGTIDKLSYLKNRE